MKLELALQAEVGDALSTEGVVGYMGKPKNITGSKNGKAYNFYSQFVTIEDGDSKIGVSLAFDSEAECLTGKGENIKIKGTMGSYEKDGNTVYKIDRAKITGRSGSSGGGGQAAPASNKDRLIVAQVAYKKLMDANGGLPVDEGRFIVDVNMIMRVGSGQPAPQQAPPSDTCADPNPAMGTQQGGGDPFGGEDF